MAIKKTDFKSFEEFYPFYLSEHSLPSNRFLHYLGTTALIIAFVSIVIAGKWNYLWILPISVYGPAWIGHYIIEKNRPATFKHPFYSAMGDFKMYWTFIKTGRI